MDWFSNIGVPGEYQGLATLIFIIAAAVFAAYSRTIGKQQGPVQPKVREFHATGQLADMGPIRELVEVMGLLAQQTIRTNLFLEKVGTELATCAKAATLAADRFVEDREEADREEEIERRAQARADEILAEKRRQPRST